MAAINRLQGRKTLVIIAHRLQTIGKCDVVYRAARSPSFFAPPWRRFTG